MTEIVEIPRDQFESMMRIVILMRCLWEDGVDNWEGYEETYFRSLKIPISSAADVEAVND